MKATLDRVTLRVVGPSACRNRRSLPGCLIEVTYSQPIEEDCASFYTVYCYNSATIAQKCSSSNRQCSKLAANSQNTLELKTEEWVSG
jgi:hypothetical protein